MAIVGIVGAKPATHAATLGDGGGHAAKSSRQSDGTGSRRRGRLSLFADLPQPLYRIDGIASAVGANLEVQMRRQLRIRDARLTDDVALVDLLTFLHHRDLERAVDGVNAAAMVDEH